jgi:hypothetical protein
VEQGPYWYLDQVEKVEIANQDKRVVRVWIPCECPKYLWNVEDTQMRGHVPISSEPIPGMRKGIFGNFRIEQGPFAVQFNDGGLIQF